MNAAHTRSRLGWQDLSAAQTQQWRGSSPHTAERVASTILLHCLIYKPHRELKHLGLRHEVAIRVSVRLLLTVSLQDRVCVSDMALEVSRAP